MVLLLVQEQELFVFSDCFCLLLEFIVIYDSMARRQECIYKIARFGPLEDISIFGLITSAPIINIVRAYASCSSLSCRVLVIIA